MADRRTKKSKEALKGTLLELLQKKDLHEVQVNKLCEKADVNRSTFYNHYQLMDSPPVQRYQLLYRIIGSFSIIRAWMAEKYLLSAQEITDMIMEKVIFNTDYSASISMHK